MAIHVFIDNSNVFGGAHRAAKEREPHVPHQALRVYFKNLFQLIEAGRTAWTRVMAGSVPPGNEDLWEHAHSWGYKTDLMKRVEDDDTGKMVEQGVDEALHLKMANVLLDFEKGTIVVVSGDGRPSVLSTSFPEQVARALKHGWDVEVWSWAAQLTGVYDRMSNPQLKVQTFDAHYHRITFVKGGIHGGVSVIERIVSPLARR